MNVSVPTESSAGNSFGRYRLVASLGAGGMADVYLAVASGAAGVGKLQVVKRLRKNLAEEQEFLSMFLDEARLAVRLNHPNVVQTNEVGQVEQDYFIAMEFLDGQPLNKILHVAKTRPPPPGFVLHVVAEALAGLHYAHELTDYDGTPLNIVHRDTSPHNIFVTYEGQTKLVDFGIAKAARRASETVVGTVKGKFAYMSPEQALAGAVDRRSDVFVMGLLLWEAIAGRRVWKGLDDMEIVTKLAAKDLPDLATECPDTPAEVVRIVGRALAHAKDDRYATAAEMRADILAYLDEARLHITHEKAREYLSSTFASRRTEMRKIIERQLARLARAGEVTAVSSTSAEVSSASLPDLGSMLTGASRTPSVSHPNAGKTPLAGSPISAVAPTPEPRTSPRWIAIGAIAAVLAGVLYLGAGRRGVAPATAAQTPVPAASPAAEPTRVEGIEVTLHADPSSAQLFLDDAALPSNPFKGRFKSDGMSHRLRIEAGGYATRSQVVVFDKDVSIDVALAPQAAGTAGADAASSPVQARGRLGGPLPSVASTAVTTAAPGTSTATPALTAPPAAAAKRSLEDPWGDGKANPGPKRTLDTAEPFK